LDNTRSKRAIVALGVLVVALSAMIIEFRPDFSLVLIALMLQGVTGGILGPAIAAISLGLVGHSALPERLGRNQRFSSVGSLTAAGLMGLIGYAFSFRAIFLLDAALTLPVLVALARIHTADIHFGRPCGAPHHHTPDRPPRAGRESLCEESGIASSWHRPVPVSTRQCVDPATCWRGSHISGGQPFIAHSIGVDRPAANNRCPDGSMGWTAGQELGATTASSHRLRRIADPCVAVLPGYGPAAATCVSVAGWSQWGSGWRDDGARHCRCHKRHRSLQPCPRSRRNGIRDRCFAEHRAVRSHSGELRANNRISEHRIGCSCRRLDHLVLDAGDEAVAQEHCSRKGAAEAMKDKQHEQR